MNVTKRKGASARRASATDAVADSGMNPALVELLDQLAEELAREYVRLMEEAALSDGDDGDSTGKEA